MDERREEREELAEIERETVDEAREQEDARRFWTVADVLAEQGAPGWRDALNSPGTSAWADAVKRDNA